CGVSAQKQTPIVVETWLANRHFPKLTVVAWARESLAVPVPLVAAPNVTILLQRLPSDELRKLQHRHVLHVCPSEAEGFGHALNEARACSSLLITTAAPPMNDLVDDGVTGLAVPVRPEN